MSSLFIFVSFISFVAFLVCRIKEADARKAAGENYWSDVTYQSIGKTKRIISVVCVISFLIGFSICFGKWQKDRIIVERQAKARIAAEQKIQAEREAMILERANSLTGEAKKFFDKKFNEYSKDMDEKAAREKALNALLENFHEKARKKDAEERAIAEAKQRAAEAKQRKDAMAKDFGSGWNTASKDADSDNTNFIRAAELLKKYYTEIQNMHPSPAYTTDVMKKPWDYYGKVVTVSGRVYSIEQYPPGHLIPKFFGKDCFKAMLKCDDDTTAAIIIVGDSDSVSEDSHSTFKGFIFGHIGLENTVYGGHSKGLAFIGIRHNN